MSHLIESILDKNYVVAESHLNEKLNSIMEKKLYEKKRMVAAQMDEVMGGKDPATLRAQGYRRAIDVLGLSPYDKAKEAAKKRAEARSKKSNQPKQTETKPKAAETSAAPEVKIEPDEVKKKETPKKPEYKRPGMLRRNINTLQGREPGYVAPKDEKDMQRGGKVGKAARAVLTGLSGYGSMAE
jgi:UTP:GlnB (protein PII) uridylyltransferase